MAWAYLLQPSINLLRAKCIVILINYAKSLAHAGFLRYRLLLASAFTCASLEDSVFSAR